MPAGRLAAIVDELRRIHAIAPQLFSPIAEGKQYEFYILAGVVKALRRMHADLEPRDINDARVGTYSFRMGPSRIFSPASSPSFLNIDLPTGEFELHNSLEVEGKSGVLHELDICILPKDVAATCRHRSRNPGNDDISFYAECKYRGDRIGLDLGRGFVGLTADVPGGLQAFVSNLSNPSIESLVSEHGGRTHFLVDTGDFGHTRSLVGWLETELRFALR